jgi:hypothetical protein
MVLLLRRGLGQRHKPGHGGGGRCVVGAATEDRGAGPLKVGQCNHNVDEALTSGLWQQ